MSTKKSDFTAKTTANDTDTFDFVQNGQNFKIAKSDLVTLFGTTGSLEQLGEVTGVPVLSKSGTVNRVRNLINGSGVSVTLSPLSGAKISHNFDVDKTGVAIMKNDTDLIPTLRSIIAGPGISVAAQNGFIQIAASATPTSTKTVIVNEISDFPTAVLGVITLEDDTQYFVTNDVSTSNRFVMGSETVLSGSDGTLITLEYTGTGTMITSVNNSNKIRDIILTCNSGSFLDVSCATGTNVFQVVSCRINCDEVGTIDNMYVVNFQNIIWTVLTDGVTFTNNNSIISYFQNIGTISAGTFIDLGTSTFDGFSFSNSFGVLSLGSTFLSGLASSGNINSGGLATVINTRALGAGTPLSGITTSDSLWEFISNSGISNSRDTLLATRATGNVVISAANTPVIIGATWTIVDQSRFLGTSGGRFTYTGTGGFISFHATISASIVTATDDCTFYFYKNGVQIAGSSITRTLTAGTNANLSLLWGAELQTSDYIEVFVENNDTAVDVTIDKAIVRFD